MSRKGMASICAVLLCLNGTSFGAVSQQESAQKFTAKVIAVLDGDTVLVRRAGAMVKIRLAEIDAPEKAQAYGTASSQSLSKMVKGKQVEFISQAEDKYGRMIAHLSVGGMDVNAEQIRRGMAWEYSNYHGNKTLIALQDEAKRVPRGLWTQHDPVPPWEWRKLHPSFPPHTVDAGCGEKKFCAEMVSCEEAMFYLTRCGLKSLDSNGDGIPCESLCTTQNNIRN